MHMLFKMVSTKEKNVRRKQKQISKWIIYFQYIFMWNTQWNRKGGKCV